MSRRKIIRNMQDELITEAEVVTRWNKKRIVIAGVLSIILIAGSVYVAKALLGNAKQVLGSKDAINKPEIRIPDERKVQEVIENAKQSLSDINPKNLVESQPQIKQVINSLEEITSSSRSAKNVVCETLCK